MVVDFIIPEESLIAISPEEVPRPDVLVWVFDSFLQRRHVFPVLPMFGPQVVGVDGCEDEAGCDDTV